MTITEAKHSVSATSAMEVVSAAIERAKTDTHNAVLEVIEERALERARLIDEKLQNNEAAGKLAGVPFLAKDNMLTFGSRTTAASKLLSNFEAPYQAEAIERLEAEGAICIGKVNLDAFAHGGSTENSAYGPTTNPIDSSRVAGGSSGGSAASVALGIVPFALGTDTGGSIRQPASFCGVVGYKPTYGAVSRYGVVAMASSTDVIGPLTTSVDDAHHIMEIIAGNDQKDSTTITSPMMHKARITNTVGVIKQWLGDGVDTEVKKAVSGAIKVLEARGYEIKEVSIPELEYSLAVYYIIVPAEIASNLARYDGIRYGVRESSESLEDVFSLSRSEGFMAENKRRILIGNYVLSSGYYDAYFRQAAKVRTLIIGGFERALSECDILLGPVSPTPAFKLGQNTDDPLSMYLADQMTVSASLAGLPAISVPTDTGGELPIGLQLIGACGDDKTVLDVAKRYEDAA